MSSNHHRITPPGGSRKRKEKDEFEYFVKPQPSARVEPQVTKFTSAKSSGTAQNGSNRLLAGYLAYEFLTKGTLFGQKFDPARAEAVPLLGPSAGWRRSKAEQTERCQKPEQQGYAVVANILKGDGARIPGIVNPTQLARWIQM